MGKSNQFSESYKREAVTKAEANGSIPQTARDLDISDKSLYRWSKEYGQAKTVVVGEATPAWLPTRLPRCLSWWVILRAFLGSNSRCQGEFP